MQRRARCPAAVAELGPLAVSAMKILMFFIGLPVRFIIALVRFTLGGLIGWLGIILVSLRFLGVIHWPWWLVSLPLEYGVIYCLYMTIDGALYRAGLKKMGGYARFTQAEIAPQIDAIAEARERKKNMKKQNE